MRVRAVCGDNVSRSVLSRVKAGVASGYPFYIQVTTNDENENNRTRAVTGVKATFYTELIVGDLSLSGEGGSDSCCSAAQKLHKTPAWARLYFAHQEGRVDIVTSGSGQADATLRYRLW